jgi:hypothetical protein
LALKKEKVRKEERGRLRGQKDNGNQYILGNTTNDDESRNVRHIVSGNFELSCLSS